MLTPVAGAEQRLEGRWRQEGGHHDHEQDGAEHPVGEHAGPAADVGEDEPDLAARHHPDTHDEPPHREPGRGPAGSDLADDRDERQRAGDREGAARGGRGRVQQAQIDGGADAHEEDRREDRRHGPDLPLDGVELVGARENEAGGEGADDERRAGQRGERGQAERERDREDQQDVAHPHPDDDIEQARDQEAPEHTATTRKPAATASVRATPSRVTAPPAATPETTLRITSPSTSSMTAAPMMIRASGVPIRPRSESTRAVIPTDVAVSVAPTKMAAVVRSAAPEAACGV